MQSERKLAGRSIVIAVAVCFALIGIGAYVLTLSKAPRFKVWVEAPDRVTAGDEVRVEVLIKNVGNEEGTHTLKVRLPDRAIEENIFLRPGEKRVLSYSFVASGVVARVEVNGISRSIIVTTPSPPGVTGFVLAGTVGTAVEWRDVGSIKIRFTRVSSDELDAEMVSGEILPQGPRGTYGIEDMLLIKRDYNQSLSPATQPEKVYGRVKDGKIRVPENERFGIAVLARIRGDNVAYFTLENVCEIATIGGITEDEREPGSDWVEIRLEREKAADGVVDNAVLGAVGKKNPYDVMRLQATLDNRGMFYAVDLNSSLEVEIRILAWK